MRYHRYEKYTEKTRVKFPSSILRLDKWQIGRLWLLEKKKGRTIITVLIEGKGKNLKISTIDYFSGLAEFTEFSSKE